MIANWAGKEWYVPYRRVNNYWLEIGTGKPEEVQKHDPPSICTHMHVHTYIHTHSPKEWENEWSPSREGHKNNQVLKGD